MGVVDRGETDCDITVAGTALRIPASTRVNG